MCFVDMRTDDIENLLDQMKIIQDVLENYYINDLVFYGSRVIGHHKETSDFDLTCRTDHIEELIKRYPNIYSPDISSERWINLTLDEAGEELSYKLKAEISLTSADSNDELYDSIRKYHIPLIINGNKLNRDELMRNILDLRTKDIPSQTERSLEAKEHYLMTGLASLTSIVRFVNFFNKKADFYSPRAIYKKAMRSDIISNIAKFSLCTEKVPKELIEKLIFNVEDLKRIATLVRTTQKNKQNYNAFELGWTVCGADDLGRDELELFAEFLFQYQYGLYNYLLMNSDHPTFSSSLHIVQQGFKNQKDLQGFYRKKFIRHQNPLQETPFKNILNGVLLKEKNRIYLN